MSLFTDLTNEEMKKIEKPEWLQPNAPQLTKEELLAAKKDAKVLSYPAIVRGHVTDPVPGQAVGLISFVFFNNDEVKNGMHGIFRLDSVWPSEESAEKRTDKILETMDSRHVVHTVSAGVWNPITNNPAFSREEVDIDLKKKVEKEHEEMKDDIFFQQREKYAKEARIDEKRRQDLENQTYKPQSDDTLTEFITKQNLLKNLEDYIIEGLKKVDDLREKVKRTKEVVELTKTEHPEFLEIVDNKPNWINQYNHVRSEVGLPSVDEKEFWGQHIQHSEVGKNEPDTH